MNSSSICCTFLCTCTLCRRKRKVLSLYSIQPRSVESASQEDERKRAETTGATTGVGMCLTDQEAVAVEEIDKEEEGEEGSMKSALGANEKDKDEDYFEDPSNIGNYMQHTQQYSDMHSDIVRTVKYSCSHNHIIPSTPVPGLNAIPVAQFPDYVKKMQQESNNKLEEEYEVRSSLLSLISTYLRCRRKRKVLALYSIQPRSVESAKQEDKKEGAENSRTAMGEEICMTEQEAVAVEEIIKEDEEEEECVQGANEEDTDEYYFEDPSNIGNYKQLTYPTI